MGAFCKVCGAFCMLAALGGGLLGLIVLGSADSTDEEQVGAAVLVASSVWGGSLLLFTVGVVALAVGGLVEGNQALQRAAWQAQQPPPVSPGWQPPRA